MRASGILTHISSLPSPCGIGTFGAAAFEFIDFLEEAGQQNWQILPLGPTSYGDSPYQSFSTFAGNPYFIDLDLLAAEGLLDPQEYQGYDWGESQSFIDYKKIYDSRFKVLEIAFRRGFIRDQQEVEAFRATRAGWVEDYALFMALKDYHGGKAWSEWPQEIRVREPQALAYWRDLLQNQVDFWVYLQYQFQNQWRAVRCYAQQKKVKIIGDLPIYVALDSADVWANPGLFWMDETLCPTFVAGVPPDYFSLDGQLWGNPLYRWEIHRDSGYAWWLERIRAVSELVDMLRIDHFRGFASFYAVPAKDETARNGHWENGPGMAFFDAVHAELGELPIIAEDLGVLTDDVCVLLEQSGFPGMKVLQFAFGENWNDPYLPHNHIRNCVVYTGTHDNDTLANWWETAMDASQKEHATRYFTLTEDEGVCWGLLRSAWASVADLVVAPIQDFLELGGEARMNTPSTLGGNWQFRVTREQLTSRLANRIERLSGLYQRSTHE